MTADMEFGTFRPPLDERLSQDSDHWPCRLDAVQHAQ